MRGQEQQHAVGTGQPGTFEGTLDRQRGKAWLGTCAASKASGNGGAHGGYSAMSIVESRFSVRVFLFIQ
jgi:hypothetical protein